MKIQAEETTHAKQCKAPEVGLIVIVLEIEKNPV